MLDASAQNDQESLFGVQAIQREPKKYKWVVYREKLKMFDALFEVDKQVRLQPYF